MYEQVETHKKAHWENGFNFTPIATLKDPYGGICHITIDDGCYVVAQDLDDGSFRSSSWIIPEVFKVLKLLPDL